MITNDELHDKMDRMIASLMEHCDSVSIIVTRKAEGDSWSMLASGDGNVYARAGAMREWLVRDDEGTRAQKRREWDE